jgi:hypothetical protein
MQRTVRIEDLAKWTERHLEPTALYRTLEASKQRSPTLNTPPTAVATNMMGMTAP